jgi:hypothetical protein
MANETTRAKTVSIACFKCGATISNSFPVEWDEPNAQHFCFSCCKKMAAFAPLPEKPLCISCGEPATEKAGKGGGTGSDLCARCWRDEFSDPGADHGE